MGEVEQEDIREEEQEPENNTALGTNRTSKEDKKVTKTPRCRLLPAPIEQLTEFNVATYL